MAEHALITSRRSPQSAAPLAGRRRLGAALLAIGAGSTLTSGIAAGTAAAAIDLVPVNLDGELIELGRRLAAEWRRYKDFRANDPDASDEALDAVIEPSYGIVDRIEQVPAHTLEGVKVKALAISWCNSGMEIDPDRFCPYPRAAQDGRIAASIVRDLLRGVAV